MNTRYKIAVAITLPFILVGLWRGLAIQSGSVDQGDCNPQDPLASCATAPQLGTPAGDLLVIGGPDLASAAVSDGSLAVIRFAPKTDVADITKFLVANKASMVGGPKNGGLYTIRLSETGQAKNDLIKQMQAQSTIVEFIATVQ